MSKYAPLATSNASQFVDILLRAFSGLPALRSPPAKPAPAASVDSAKGRLAIQGGTARNPG